MKIQSVKINNYKGINASLVLSEGINVITGRNGAGKSNLLEAIRLTLENETLLNQNVVTKGKSLASVKVTLEDKKIFLDKYSVLKKIYRSGEVKTYYSDTLPDSDINCLLLDYDSHCFMERMKLAEFAKELQEKAKNTQIIIVSMSENIINIADCVYEMKRKDDNFILSSNFNRVVA